MRILVDTGAWYALADESDFRHEDARRFFTHNVASCQFLTTDLIIAETCALISAHLGHHKTLRFWRGLRGARILMLAAEPADLEAAWRITMAFSQLRLSFTDCVTLAVMERLAMEWIFGFDARFLAYRFGHGRVRGFQLVPP